MILLRSFRQNDIDISARDAIFRHRHYFYDKYRRFIFARAYGLDFHFFIFTFIGHGRQARAAVISFAITRSAGRPAADSFGLAFSLSAYI